tara:strand:- start:6811 stop:7170 length:360 start_codon:yes stop_codon:yes gene_type:complete
MKKDFIYILVIVSGILSGCNNAPKFNVSDTYSNNWYTYTDSIKTMAQIKAFSLSIDSQINAINTNIQTAKNQSEKIPGLKLDCDIFISHLKTCSIKYEIIKLNYAYDLNSIHAYHYQKD